MFESLWIDFMATSLPYSFALYFREIPITLCGNKIDKKRVITEEEGRQYATSRGLQYYETSANTGDNVQDMFKDLFQISLRKMMATTS